MSLARKQYFPNWNSSDFVQMVFEDVDGLVSLPLHISFQLELAHPISSHAPVASAYQFPGHVTLMTTAATGQMSLLPAVRQLYSFDVGRLFFLIRFQRVTQQWYCLSTAYPTCFPLTQFTCNNGRCINVNWRCDNGSCLLWSSACSLLLIRVQVSLDQSFSSFYPLYMFSHPH